MEILIIVVLLILLTETSVLFVRSVYKKPQKSERRKIYMDTSSLIDGRIVAVAQTGFIGDDILIPRSVIHELQLLADGKDSEKRALARRGMDNASELERVVYCNTYIVEDELDRTPVDDRLINLAKANRGLICTNDYNLNKVAATEHIDVLNVNDLAIALTSGHDIGDRTRIKITEKGDKRSQGIGHLPNGTMVVVDRASKDIGNEINIEIVRRHQTSAGLMIFAKKIQL